MKTTIMHAIYRYVRFAAIAITLLSCYHGEAQTVSHFFMLLADPQMGMFEKDTSWLQESANLDMAIDTANRLHPAFLIICGDLVNKRGDGGEIDAFFAAARRLDGAIPLHLVAGNHDVGNVPTAQTLSDYRARFGADFYTFQTDGLFAIVLDSSLMGTKGNEQEDKQQLIWLEKQLKDAQEKGFGSSSIAVFQHIPFFLSNAGEADQYFNIPATSRRRYLQLLHRYSVEHVFAGHYHRNANAADGALQMLTSGPIGKPLGPDDSGLRLVHFGTKWQVPYYALGRLPDSTTITQWVNSW